eukprot:2293032-Rhodomonas_salina.2
MSQTRVVTTLHMGSFARGERVRPIRPLTWRPVVRKGPNCNCPILEFQRTQDGASLGTGRNMDGKWAFAGGKSKKVQMLRAVRPGGFS